MGENKFCKTKETPNRFFEHCSKRWCFTNVLQCSIQLWPNARPRITQIEDPGVKEGRGDLAVVSKCVTHGKNSTPHSTAESDNKQSNLKSTDKKFYSIFNH